MPLYMDVHSLDGAVTFDDVGKAHPGGSADSGKLRRQLSALLGGW